VKNILILLILCSGPVAAEKFPYTEALKIYSSTQLRWWGFKVYKAELWTAAAGQPDFSRAMLLHLEYQRDIKAADLLKTTREEWQRMSLTGDRQAEIWLKQLVKIWPNVRKGDILSTWFDGEDTHFYQKEKKLGTVRGKAFARAFLSIWLDKKSRTPELRKRNR